MSGGCAGTGVGRIRGTDAATVRQGQGMRGMGMRGTGSHDVEMDGVFIPDGGISARRKPGTWGIFHTVYGVAFPMFAKTTVVGPAADPLFAELARVCHRDGEIWISVMHPAMLLRGVSAVMVVTLHACVPYLAHELPVHRKRGFRRGLDVVQARRGVAQMPGRTSSPGCHFSTKTLM